MSKKIKPTLYIGLGDAGATLIEHCSKVLKARNPQLSSVAKDFVVNSKAKMLSYFDGKEYGKFDFSNNPIDKNCYSNNYKTFIDKEEDVVSLLRKQLTEINNIDNRRTLISTGYEIGDPQVFIVSPLGDTIGSSILLGIAKLVQRVLKEGNYAYSQITGLYLLPDLFHSKAYLSQVMEIHNDFVENEQVACMDKDKSLIANGKVKYFNIEQIGKKPMLFVKGLNHRHEVDLHDIDQGSDGHSYFLSLLGAIARTQPNHIKNMIIDNQDGTVSVRFYDQTEKEKIITIDQKFWFDENKKPLYSKIGDENDDAVETWVMAIEKAWAKCNKGYEFINGDGAPKLDYVYAITGNSTERIKIDEFLKEEAFINDLNEHFEKKTQPVTFVSKATKEDHDVNDILYDTSYVLKEINLNNKTINIYNPQGHGHFYNVDIDFVKRHFRAAHFHKIRPFEQITTQRSKIARDCAYARTYACLSEIDYTLDKNEAQGNRIIQHNFVVSSKNHLNVSLGDFNEMLVSLTEFSLMLMNEQFATQHLNVHLQDETDNKTNRYSSIGYSTYIYPEAKMVDGLINKGKNEILNEIQSEFRNNKFDINTISGEVKYYYQQKKLGDLVNRMSLLEDGGQPIFREFQFNGERDENVDLSTFYNNVEEASGKFEAEVFGKDIIANLSTRKNKLTDFLVSQVKSQNDKQINNANEGINYAHAFTSVLLREDCSSLTGQLLENQQDLRTVENKVLEFYRSKTDLPSKLETFDQLSVDIKNKEKRIAYLTDEVDEIGHKILEEMGKVGSGDKDTTVELTSLNNEIKSKHDELERLKKEVSTDKEKFTKTQDEIEKIKRQLESPDFRKEIREQDLAEQFGKTNEIRDGLKATEELRQTELSLLDKIKIQRDKTLKWLLIFNPLIIFGIPAAIITYLHNFYYQDVYEAIVNLADTPPLMLYLELFVFGLVVYGIWAFMKYRNKILKPMNEVKARLHEHNSRKVGLLNDYTQANSDQFKLRFDHLKYANTYEAISKVINAVKQNKRDLGGFKSDLIQNFESTTDELDALYFDNNLFESSVIELEDLNHYQEKATASDFFIDKENRKIINYYNTYKQVGDLNELDKDLDEFFRSKYRHLSGKTIYDFLLRDPFINQKSSNEVRMKLLNDASQVYINLKDFGTGDPTEEMSDLYLYQLGEGDANKVTTVLAEQGLRAEGKEENNNKNHLSIFRAKRGFPAFKITLIDECRNILNQYKEERDGLQDENFYIYYDAKENDLFPTALLLGNKNDITRIDYVKGLVLGILKKDSNGVHLGGDKLGENQKESIDFLKSLRGEGVKSYLNELVSKSLDNISESKKEGNLVKLIKNYATDETKLDKVDRAILDDWIRSLI